MASLLVWPFGFPFEEYWSEDGPLLVASRAVDVTFLLVEAGVALVYFAPLMLAWEGRTLGKRARASCAAVR